MIPGIRQPHGQANGLHVSRFRHVGFRPVLGQDQQRVRSFCCICAVLGWLEATQQYISTAAMAMMTTETAAVLLVFILFSPPSIELGRINRSLI
ncbi:hypothetical protein AC482_00210 [miscellaneous Crenarchaeota group-15 archaeon DG-45]|uniref:Uncharacterized protein n=1 Tax=miscellaneous Crenarchaeota group-15 archaeon DG-45 TaxID=1685127 RepID=A0A0M0BSP1_9ARCH|nr:MAG: hypothetical protein AC482_00210 [miscellaneous Crenarchaeota group-15 archaeon DG-45]